MTWRVAAWPLLCCLLSCGGTQSHGVPPLGDQTPESQTPGSVTELADRLAPGEPESALPVEADDPRTGSDAALVTLVAFLDFQCPYCAEGFETMTALRQRYSGEQLRVVFKHLPLESHTMALPAAVAGQAVMQSAGSDAFFDFARLAFAHQKEITFLNMAAWAEQAGITRSAYNEAVSSEHMVARVVRDARLAQELGVNQTPSFFVNGRLLDGSQPVSTMWAEIDAELLAMKSVAPRGRAAAYAERVTKNSRASLARAIMADDPQDYRLPIEGSPTLGPRDAPVTITMFTDFECPYCKRADETIEKLERKYAGKLRLVFKHRPLPFHSRALPAARLAELVREKKGDAAFFQVSRQIFARAPDLSVETLRELGRAAGLGAKELGALSGSNQTIEARIEADSFLGDDVLVAGTPHFFINGKRLAGARPASHFEALIEAELDRAHEAVATGVRPEEIYSFLQREAIQPGAPQKVVFPEAAFPSPVRGGDDAAVTIHVFSDFQCPYCKRAEQTMAALDREFPQKLRFVWHNLPLDFHDKARPAARAAEEAFRQGKSAAFWKMHAALFGPEGEPPALEETEILEHGRALGLDLAALRAALAPDSPSQSLDADAEIARQLGIRGTPAFVVGDYLVTGARDLDHFRRVVRLNLAPPPNQSRDDALVVSGLGASD